MQPIELLNNWLSEEQSAGVTNPRQAVLATCNKRDAIPHARVVAIREIDEKGLLFFTQRNTKKVSEITDNPIATLVFWLEISQREIIVEGSVIALSDAENDNYWQGYPRENQVRFASYAPTSSQPISSKAVLENKKRELAIEFADKALPLNPFYCGFKIIPNKLVFYAFRTDELSDVFEYRLLDGNWIKQWLSP